MYDPAAVPDVLIYADSLRSPEMRHEVPLVVPDAFLYAERDGRQHVLASSFELGRIGEVAPHLEALPYEEFGIDELYAQGRTREEIELEIVLRAAQAFTANAAFADEFIVSHGAQTAVGHDMGSGPIAPDEPVCLDLFPRDRESGCFADMTRVFVVGEPSDELLEWHRLCKEALERSVAAARPGTPGSYLFKITCCVF